MKCLECGKREALKNSVCCSKKCEELHLSKIQNSFDFNRMMIAKGLREGLL